MDAHTGTQTDGKYAVERDSGVKIYIPSFIKIGSGFQKLMGRGYRHRQSGDRISLLLFFKNEENRLQRLRAKNMTTMKRNTRVVRLVPGGSPSDAFSV
jgi:hypothetical protein